jgi:hypothetical protein
MLAICAALPTLATCILVLRSGWDARKSLGETSKSAGNFCAPYDDVSLSSRWLFYRFLQEKQGFQMANEEHLKIIREKTFASMHLHERRGAADCAVIANANEFGL